MPVCGYEDINDKLFMVFFIVFLNMFYIKFMLLVSGGFQCVMLFFKSVEEEMLYL